MTNLKRPFYSPTESDVVVRTSNVAVAVDDLRMTEIDPDFMDKFLQQHVQYRQTVTARAKQLQPLIKGFQTATTEVFPPIHLKNCVDAQHSNRVFQWGL